MRAGQAEGRCGVDLLCQGERGEESVPVLGRGGGEGPGLPSLLLRRRHATTQPLHTRAIRPGTRPVSQSEGGGRLRASVVGTCASASAAAAWSLSGCRACRSWSCRHCSARAAASSTPMTIRATSRRSPSSADPTSRLRLRPSASGDASLP
jgi:hypothetical protein